MIKNMNHISFTVDNLEKQIEFYSCVCGLKLTSLAERDADFSEAVSGVKGASMKIAYMSGEDYAIELIKYVTGQGEKLDTRTCNVGSSHICFNVSDYDEWLDKMKINNVEMRGRLCTVPAGPNKGKRVCYMTDPEGNNLEFMEAV